ncbi:MAG: hypothetical protein ACO35F_10855, partial [Ilumatobacteraceae bacterium]
ATFAEAAYASGSALVPAALERYGSLWQPEGDTIRPLLVTAHSSRTRGFGLDEIIQGNDGTVTFGAGLLEIDLNAGSPSVFTTDSFTWSYYCGGHGSTPIWSPCTPEESYDYLDEAYGDVVIDPSQDPTGGIPPLEEADLEVQNLAMHLMYQGISNGLSNITAINSGNATVFVNTFVVATDEDLASQVESGLGFLPAGIKAVSNYIWWGNLKSSQPILSRVANLQPDALLTAKFSSASLGAKAAIGVAFAGVAVGLAVAAYYAQVEGNKTAAIVLQSAVLGAQALLLIAQAYSLSLIASKIGGGVVSITSLSSRALAMTKGAVVVGAVISVGITWGFFIYNAVANGWSAGSIELNQAFADAVAATILTALLSALSLTGVGLIVVGIIALVDGILTLLCEVADIDTRSELTNGGCF